MEGFAIGEGVARTIGVVEVRPLAELVELGGHRQFPAGGIDERDIDCRAAVVPRAPGRVGHVAGVGLHLPERLLHGERPVAVEHLQPEPPFAELRLHAGEPFGRRPLEKHHVGGIQPPPGDVVGRGIPVVDHQRRFDRLQIDEVAARGRPRRDAGSSPRPHLRDHVEEITEHHGLLRPVAVLGLHVHVGDSHAAAPDRERAVVLHGRLVLDDHGVATAGEPLEQARTGDEEKIVSVAAGPKPHPGGVGGQRPPGRVACGRVAVGRVVVDRDHDIDLVDGERRKQFVGEGRHDVVGGLRPGRKGLERGPTAGGGEDPVGVDPVLRAPQLKHDLAAAGVPKFNERSAAVAEHLAGRLDGRVFVVVHAHEGHGWPAVRRCGRRRVDRGGHHIDPHVTDEERPRPGFAGRRGGRDQRHDHDGEGNRAERAATAKSGMVHRKTRLRHGARGGSYPDERRHTRHGDT